VYQNIIASHPISYHIHTNMPPQFFSSSYKQYKDDTGASTIWLGRAAEACGHQAKPKKKLS
jgi:hypothetical protein